MLQEFQEDTFVPSFLLDLSLNEKVNRYLNKYDKKTLELQRKPLFVIQNRAGKKKCHRNLS